MSAILYFLLFEFGDVFYENSASKIFYLVGIVGSSALIYFLLSILFKSFSISDFKSKSYETR